MSAAVPGDIKAVRDNARCLYTMDQVLGAVDRLAVQISEDYRDASPVLLTVMNGGLIFAGHLLPRMDFPLEHDYLHATRYQGETMGAGLEWTVKPSARLRERHVLILDDILDVGTTLWAIVESCRNQGAASVATAVLVEKKHERKVEPGRHADYTGLDAEDAYLFGCGMDYRNYWRNAPGIFAVTQE